MSNPEDISLAEEIVKCKVTVYNDISEIRRDIHTIVRKQTMYDENQSEIRKELKKHELQRIKFSDTITKTLEDVVIEVQNLKSWAVQHDKSEMNKYDEIIISQEKTNKALDEITTILCIVKDDTEKNTSFIDKLKKYWGRITLIGTGIAGTIGFIYWLYEFLEGHGIVIVFEKGAQ